MNIFSFYVKHTAGACRRHPALLSKIFFQYDCCCLGQGMQDSWKLEIVS